MQTILPSARFSTQAIPPTSRYEAWRNLVSSVFEPNPPQGHPRTNLRAGASSIHLGSALVVSAEAEAQHFTRSRRLIATEGLDHYLIQVYRTGICEGTYGDVQNTVHPGDIKIIDLTQPFHTLNTDFDNITLTIPRASLAPLLDRPDHLHGTVLPRTSALARVLGDHIKALADNGAGLDRVEGIALGAASARLVAACVGASPRVRDEIMPYRTATAAQAIRDFIDINVAEPWLEPGVLAQRFRMSRAQLYRLFDTDGGVAAYIRTRRLQRAFLAITDPVQARRGIGGIALGFGFGSEAHFSRLFRRTFGLTPSEARAGAATIGAVRRTSFINDWMRGLAQSTARV